jgi:hypothetical protein
VLIGTADGLYGADGTRAGLDGRDVAWLATAADGDWWAVVDGGLMRGAGGDWEPIPTPDELTARCCLEVAGTVLVGTSEAHLLHLSDGELEPIGAFAAAPDRDTWFTPWGGPPDTRSLDAERTDAATDAAEGAIFVNVHVGGVLRAAEPLGPWRPTLDIDVDVHEVRTAPGAVLVAAARGLGISRDSGGTWSFTTAGLHRSYCRAVAVAGDHVLVSASDGPHGARGALYRRPLADDDAPLERCDDVGWVDGNIDTGWLAADGETVACATPDGRLLTSADAGVTWARRAAGLPDVRFVAV